MKKCVIVGGAPIEDYNKIKAGLPQDGFYIFCDSGLYHKDGLGVTPSLIVGDFDSHPKPSECGIETLILPCEKDDTDTVYAIKQAFLRGYTDFVLVGVVGARLDHTLGNVYALTYIAKQGGHGIILDDFGEMEMVYETPVVISDTFKYFSLINICGKAQNVTVTGAKYPLAGAEIDYTYQYGVSNEPLKGGATVKVGSGSLLLIKIRT